MVDEYLNENLEETTVDETVVEEPIDEEMMVMPEEIPPQRVNPFCVICKNAITVIDVNNKWHNLYDIQSNSSWSSNPYGEDYAVVPDEMVTDIMETRGFCDFVLNEDGTEVVEFTAREIPTFPVPEPEPTVEDRVVELEAENAELAEQIAVTEMTMIENYEAQEEINAQTENALIEIYELMEA